MTTKSTRLTVKVTATDIREGQKNRHPRSRTCPVARAISRAVGEPCSVASKWGKVAEHPGARYDLPAKVRTKIDAFDADLKVKPFSFTIARPL